jgi:hypothetical protein
MNTTTNPRRWALIAASAVSVLVACETYSTCPNSGGSTSTQVLPCSYCVQLTNGNWIKVASLTQNGCSCNANVFTYPVVLDLRCGYFPTITYWINPAGGISVLYVIDAPSPLLSAACTSGICFGAMGPVGQTNQYMVWGFASCPTGS